MVDTLRNVAEDHGAEAATVALARLRSRSGSAAAVAGGRIEAQVPALMASAELTLTPQEIATLVDHPFPWSRPGAVSEAVRSRKPPRRKISGGSVARSSSDSTRPTTW